MDMRSREAMRRGGQVVEFGGPSSDEFATIPTFHGGAICQRQGVHLEWEAR